MLALIYIDRLIRRNNFLLTELNVHRVVITAVLLAAKFFDDAYYNNAYYAKVGGVLVSEMNGLEVDFLFRIHFSLHVTPELFHKYRAELMSHSGITKANTNQGTVSPPVDGTVQNVADQAMVVSSPANTGSTSIPAVYPDHHPQQTQQQQQQQQQQTLPVQVSQELEGDGGMNRFGMTMQVPVQQGHGQAQPQAPFVHETGLPLHDHYPTASYPPPVPSAAGTSAKESLGHKRHHSVTYITPSPPNTSARDATLQQLGGPEVIAGMADTQSTTQTQQHTNPLVMPTLPVTQSRRCSQQPGYTHPAMVPVVGRDGTGAMTGGAVGIGTTMTTTDDQYYVVDPVAYPMHPAVVTPVDMSVTGLHSHQQHQSHRQSNQHAQTYQSGPAADVAPYNPQYFVGGHMLTGVSSGT